MKPYNKPSCTHRYRIAEPNGPLVEGVCQLCGNRRTYRAAEADSKWSGESKPKGSFRKEVR